MPVFVADSVGMAVRDGLEVYGRENIHNGDVIVCNHAAVQGQHLNNTVMYTPVFAGHKGDDLIGFFAVNCHWIDIGGSAIGSVSYSSTDIFMEGLQLRSIKIWSKGEPIEEVFRIIENNTRFPLELLGRYRSAARRLLARPRSDPSDGRQIWPGSFSRRAGGDPRSMRSGDAGKDSRHP